MPKDPNVGLWPLLSGEVQAEIREEINRLEDLQSGLREGDRALLKEVLREIIEENRRAEFDEADASLAGYAGSLAVGGLEHENTPLLVTAAKARIPVWLHGEAGSGKSTAAENLAERWELDFRSISLCPTTSKSDLMGYRDAQGTYHGTGFREVYEHGGVFLFDEIDNAHPSTLALINHALANGVAEFPDGQVRRNPDAIIVAAANTIGRGATAQYVGRAVIDAATRDRFAYIPWDIDEALEEQMIDPSSHIRRKPINVAEGGIPSAREWLGMVREARAAISELGIRHLSSPRAALYGAKLAHLGIGRKWLQELCIYKGMSDTDRHKIEEHIRAKRSRR